MTMRAIVFALLMALFIPAMVDLVKFATDDVRPA